MVWSRIGRIWVAMLCVACLSGTSNAQTKKPSTQQGSEQSASSSQSKKKPAKGTTKKPEANVEKSGKGSIKALKGGKFAKPTANLLPGSVGYYFYPVTQGSYWKLRTVKSLYDIDNTLLSSDTLFSKETVTSNAAQSIQGLPLIRCQSLSYKRGMTEEQGRKEEVDYYVDDSLIMAAFNNSVQHGENRALLVTPLRVGFAWPEKHGDTIMTEIVSLNEPVETVAGKFESSVVTVTRMGYGELAKYFVGGMGIVKMVFRGPAGGHPGTLVVVTDLMEVYRAPVEGVGSNAGTSSTLPVIDEKQ